MARTHSISTNRYGVNSLIVSTSVANGDYTTLASAMADASVGDTIFLRDSVTENVTITPGVNITAWSGGSLNTPSITGTLTMTGAGTSTISGLRLITNSAALIAVTGSAASILNLNNCYLNCSNNTGITYSSSSSSSAININNCFGNLGTTGIGLYTMSSTGNLTSYFTNITNSGASTTTSSNSAGTAMHRYGNFFCAFLTSSSGISSFVMCDIQTNAINTTCLTTSETATSGASRSFFLSGTASALSIGSGTSFNSYLNIIDSSNTNAITGAGTVVFISSEFSNTSHKSNVTTQTGGAASGLTQGTAPSAGFLGERISSYATTVSLSNSTGTNITSISLTAGVWDISMLTRATYTGVSIAYLAGISATSATITGNNSDQSAQFNAVCSAMSVSVPAWRVVLTSTTTYYLVGQSFFSTGTCSGEGRISATRVG